ncbi:hypothetical protein [Chryseobacterium sp. JV558]|uniref:hypothetical protein n=1 Tax=Chryseobacterium sp. JV558 TaxID=2663236 RepID=UPI00299CDC4B|nr:hypothetical protein [Chryseobacterium sp. JV558]MDW9379939.1 hypothetical protein [Chryseobacterium sp. JV558]
MKTLQTLGILLLIGVLNTIITAEYIKLLKLPSGNVAMLPIAIMAVSGISLAVSTALILIISIKKQLNTVISMLIYHIIYFISGALFGMDWLSFTNVDLFIIFTAFMVWGFIFVSIKFFQSRKKSPQ